jgi:hypothetical protein
MRSALDLAGYEPEWARPNLQHSSAQIERTLVVSEGVEK